MTKHIEIVNVKGFILRGYLELPENAKRIVCMFHGFTGKSKSQMLSYRDNPLDKLDILVKNKIPVILVASCVFKDKIFRFFKIGASSFNVLSKAFPPKL